MVAEVAVVVAEAVVEVEEMPRRLTARLKMTMTMTKMMLMQP